ncbi:molybdenum cofactor guanylyltransferase [Actinomycetospora sp. NBRC 106378]|uniref:molybdenum cofactor guanylyltransferase n=1 Tax=Actinomycetospora sp. NBRC 106378 TaxID=3032208 RepID=UPI0024A59AF1|nr:molybdenum cofactor guanylyltransferase [Actinomycetospora sp. NBRC 106378]GLZ52815.1 putative molybdenum cofactor guanylyltransferase [Actinomycetospora sp. NBRC 106378]
MSDTTAAAVVLAGGRSSRMGRDKALLSWADGTLLDHVVAVARRAGCGPVVVVGAAGFPRPVDGEGVLAVTDDEPGRGPLQGIATGLTAAAGAGRATAFLCSVDLPRLHPAYVGAVLAALGDAEVALPVLHGHRQPLAAAYRTTLGPRATGLLAAGARRPAELFAVSEVREITADDLLADPVVRAADPGLRAVADVDTPEEYAAAVAREREEPDDARA